MTHHLMIDWETHGLGSRPVVIQLGVTVFDTHGTGGELPEGASQEWNIDPQTCQDLGFEEDASTLQWWADRPAATREAVYAEPRYSIQHVMDNLTAFHRRYQPARVWCHGATFDVPVAESYYRALSLQAPWNFYDVRDTRTLFEMAEGLTGWRRPKTNTAHTGRADAIAQARDVQAAMAALRSMERTKTVGSISVSERFVPPLG